MMIVLVVLTSYTHSDIVKLLLSNEKIDQNARDLHQGNMIFRHTPIHHMPVSHSQSAMSQFAIPGQGWPTPTLTLESYWLKGGVGWNR